MREYVEFHNATARNREASLVFDLRALPPELAVTFLLSAVTTVSPIPASVTGLDGVQPPGPEDEPIPPGFDRTVYKAARSALVEVPGVVLQPFGQCAALVRVQNTGTLPRGSRYAFEVQQHLKPERAPGPERLGPHTLVGGGTYVVVIEGDPDRPRPEVTPAHESGEKEADRLEGYQGYVPPWGIPLYRRRQEEQGRRAPGIDRVTFLHRARPAGKVGNSTVVDHTATNGNMDAVLFVTANWNPGVKEGVYNNHHTGVWYDAGSGRWQIFNQDRASMPAGAAFNVEVKPVSETAFVHQASGTSVRQNYTTIDHPATNGNPEALLHVTPNWNPWGTAGIYHDHATGVWYDGSVGRWAVFNHDLTAMPAGAAFNVSVEPLSGVAFLHQASEATVAQNFTTIDHPSTNGSSQALLQVTANWNPGDAGGVYNDHPAGVWHDDRTGRWAVFNQDLAPMPVGAAFNVVSLPGRVPSEGVPPEDPFA